MNRSQELNELFAALSKLQGKIQNPEKNVQAYKYKYAGLPQYIEISKELLAEHGLSILQFPGQIRIEEVTEEITEKDTKNQVHIVGYHTVRMPVHTIHTQISHESGQYIEVPMDILAEKKQGNSWAQSIGTAISYARRYVQGGVFNICPEDEDNDGVVEKPKFKGYEKPKQQSYPKEDMRLLTQQLTNTQPPMDKIAQVQANNLKREFKAHPELLTKSLEWAGVAMVENLTIDKYNKIMDTLREKRLAETTNPLAQAM